jgi:glucosamine-phosphate N-acetyltransferase
MPIIEIQEFKGNYADIFGLLETLTSAPVIEKAKYDEIIANLDMNHKIFLFIKDQMAVGIVTLLIEQKLIHEGNKVAHIEDLVVDRAYRNQGISSALINTCVGFAEQIGCYKIILDCNKEMISFYENFGFLETEVQMRYYM